MEVKVHQLYKYYGETKAVDGVSFSLHSGQILGFIGPNGAGKTSTIKIMASLNEPTSGDVFYDGISIIRNPEDIRHIVGYMPDSLPAQKDMTVHHYLDFFARAYGIREPKRSSIVEEIEEFTGLTGLREKSLFALSKGMKQRVSLARALIHDPQVLIMDEPAAGLDPRARIELRELIKILAEQGKAILLSSHILTELAEICTHVAIIEKGNLLRSCPIEDLAKEKETKHGTCVLLRAFEETETLCKLLLELPYVDTVEDIGDYIEIEIDGNDEQCSQVLTMLIEKKVRIIEFHQRQSKLEDVFMNITQGEVQ